MRDFWRIINNSVSSLQSEQLSVIAAHLRKLSDVKLYECWVYFYIAVDELHSWQLFNAADFFFGESSFSDDTWEYHRRWIVSRGEQEWKLAIKSPDDFYSRFVDEVRMSNESFEALTLPFLNEIERRVEENPDSTLTTVVDRPRLRWQDTPAKSSDFPNLFPKIAGKLEKYGVESFWDWEFPKKRK